MEDTAEILAASAADDIVKYLVLVAESYAEQIEDIEDKIEFLGVLEKTLTGRSCYKGANDSGRIASEISRLRSDAGKGSFDAIPTAC